MGNQDEIVPILQRKVNNLYGDSNLITFLTYDGPSGKLKDILKKVEPHNLSEPMAAVHDQGRIIHDWTVRVRVKEHDLGTSFSVLFFLGELPNNEHPSRSSPSYVGSYDTFVNSALDSCENCQSRADAGAIIEGYVHLNDKIAEVSDLDSFEPDKVSPYLKESLSWYVEKVCESSEEWLGTTDKLLLGWWCRCRYRGYSVARNYCQCIRNDASSW